MYTLSLKGVFLLYPVFTFNPKHSSSHILCYKLIIMLLAFTFLSTPVFCAEKSIHQNEVEITRLVDQILSNDNYVSTKDLLPSFNLGNITIETTISQNELLNQISLYNIVSQRLMTHYLHNKDCDLEVISPYLNASSLSPKTLRLLYTIKSHNEPNGTATISYATLKVTIIDPNSNHVIDEFIDLPINSSTYAWCSDIIYSLRDKNIITGYPDNTFRPDAPVTRAEFCAMMTRALDLKASSKTPFTDLHLSSWATDFVAKAANAHLIKGTTPTTFDPLGNITNEQALTIAVRALDNTNGSLNLSTDQVFVLLFKLAHPEKVSAWARPTVAEAIYYDLIYDYTKYDSTLPITRAEVAVLFYRMFIQLDHH